MIDDVVDAGLNKAIGAVVDSLNSRGDFESMLGVLLEFSSDLLRHCAHDQASNALQQIHAQCAVIGAACVMAEGKRRGLKLPKVASVAYATPKNRG